MFKLIIIICTVMISLFGCKSSERLDEGNHKDVVEEISVNEDESTNKTDEKTTLSNDEYLFEIVLPEGASVTKKTTDDGVVECWGIERDGYDVKANFPNSSFGVSCEEWIMAGWVEIYKDECELSKEGIPLLSNIHREYSNYENTEKGYLCEGIFEVYSNSTIVDNSIPESEWYSYYWCLGFVDENGKCNQVFLNKKCFEKEEALEIAANYVPYWGTK